MEVVLSRKAQDDLNALARSNPKVERNIRAHLHRLSAVFERDKQLKGLFRGYRRHRVGDYRIVYRADPKDGILLVVTIGHRRDIYDK